MTRSEQVAAALALLKPPPPEHEAWRGRVENTLDSLDWWCKGQAGFKAPSTKPGKAALRAHVNALRRVQKTYDALPPTLRSWFSLAETALVVPRSVVERELERAEALRAKKPAARPKRDAVLGKATARSARQLLLLMRGREPSLTRGGEWERLSKVLSNGAPVFEHMRVLKRDMPRPVKLKGKTAPLTR